MNQRTPKPLTGLFLGAGATYEAGMPLTLELTAEIKNWLTPEKIRTFNAGWRTQGGGYSDAVIDDLVMTLQKPDAHYEAILGYLELQFRRQRSLPQEYHGLYSWLVELVYILLYYRQVNNKRFFGSHLKFYDGIRALADSNTPLWIFTLNHDVIPEMIAARHGIPLHSGFSPSTITLPRRDASGAKKGEMRAAVLTKHELENNAMYFPNPVQPGIYLLKIHGALDVFTFNDGHDLLKLLPDKGGEDGIVDILRAANEDLFYLHPGALGGKVKATNEIAYADDQGIMQFLRRSLLAGAFKFDARAQQVLPKSMLKHFRENLNFVTNLVCIGYSFGDSHVNMVLREWIELSPQRRIEIVSPGAKDVPQFLLHVSSQVTITNQTATDYFDGKAGIVRPKLEQLEKRVAVAARVRGKEQADKVMATFVNQNNQRITQGLMAKLNSLPQFNGRPDESAIGDPAELGKRWASELRLSQEEFLEGLLARLETSDQS